MIWVGAGVLSIGALSEGSLCFFLQRLTAMKVWSSSTVLAVLVGMEVALALWACRVMARPEGGLAELGPGSGGGALQERGIAFGGGMAALSSASIRVMRGVMAALMAAVISEGSDSSAAGSAGEAAAFGQGLAFAAGLGRPVRSSGVGGAFFGRGVGEGAVGVEGTRGGAVVRPLGVAKGEGCLAAR
jgi:hypothetical protein